MKNYNYIIIGGGMTASAAVMGIRQEDEEGSIALFTKEKYGPYNRPPLTKSLWNGKSVEDIMRPMSQFNVDQYFETPITRITPEEKTIRTKNGDIFHYEKLLLATGGSPIQLPETPDGVIYYRTRQDYHDLQALVASKDSFCVIGAGFIGSEIAAALANTGKDVTMVFPEKGISGLIFPDDLSEFLNSYYEEKGIKVLSGWLVENIEKSETDYRVKMKNLEDNAVSERIFDGVIVGIGIHPNIHIAKEAGIKVDNGILVNETLQTNQPDIFAAGDVAAFFNSALDKTVRVEHEDNANTMGLQAGINMAGKMSAYEHFPFSYSDLFDLGYEAVGELSKDFEIFSDWIEEFKKGSLYYLDEGKIRGVIFWNLWGKVDVGRELIREGKTFKKSELRGLIT